MTSYDAKRAMVARALRSRAVMEQIILLCRSVISVSGKLWFCRQFCDLENLSFSP